MSCICGLCPQALSTGVHGHPDRDDPLTAGARAFHDQTQVYRAAIWGAPIRWEDLAETTREALRRRVKPVVEAALKAAGVAL